ncbi:MAG: hypothetical protein GY749_38415 [Desulfobacteraceae bacterium]|nr:hypothetical protein [Desulfobacteraceae bacterium]
MYKPICVKNEATYCTADGNFTGKWYDHYERALSCMEGSCLQEAIEDIDESLKHRPTDERMARTYGMHFIDYFPHREKGLIHYLMNDYDAAKSELEESLRHVPDSAKTLFYLDKVRKIILERDEKTVSFPKITVKLGSDWSEISDEIWTKADPVFISGTAKDRQFVSKISVSGKPVFMEASDIHVEFEESLQLDQGRHEIDITARNLLDGKTEHHIIVNVDRSGPVIIIKKIDPGIDIQGYIYDDSEVASLILKQENEIRINVKNGAFTVPLTPGTKSVKLLARDKLGNETQARINTDILRTSAFLLAAQNKTGYKTDAGQNLISRNAQKPGIFLKGCKDQETAFKESIRIEAEVISENNIGKLTINESPVLFDQAGRIIAFSHFVRLIPGENTVKIKAADELGQESIKEIFITRQIPKAFQLQHRYSLAIYPFINQEYSILRKHLLQSFTKRKRFCLKLKETNSPPGSDPAYGILEVTVYRTINGIEIVAKIVEVSTFRIVGIFTEKERKVRITKDAYYDTDYDTENLSVLESLAEELAEKFHRAFPMIDGRIISNKGKKNVVVKPEKGEPEMKWPTLIYREKKPGNPFGTETEIIGYASVSEKFAQGNYIAKIIEFVNMSEIKAKDRMVTQ